MPVSGELQSGTPPALDESLAATLQHIEFLHGKREHLRTGQIAAEEQFLHRTGQIYTAGEMTEVELAHVYRAYAAVAVTGFMKRWEAIVPVHPGRMQHILRNLKSADRHAPNMPDGTWQGTWPLCVEDRIPAYDTCVVYVLYDTTNVPCYVGSTMNLGARLKGHAKDGKSFVWWTAYRCADREAAYRLEEKLLNEHKPYLNKKRWR